MHLKTLHEYISGNLIYEQNGLNSDVRLEQSCERVPYCEQRIEEVLEMLVCDCGRLLGTSGRLRAEPRVNKLLTSRLYDSQNSSNRFLCV